MTLSRRHFLRRASAVPLGFAGLRSFLASPTHGRILDAPSALGFGPLKPDPKGVLDLPPGFSYLFVSRAGDRMADGLLVPGQPDGMAAFPAPPPHAGKTIIVRNHELVALPRSKGAFGAQLELLRTVPDGQIYDRGNGIAPFLGGTTTLLYDTRTRTLDASWLSLAGTAYNCAGGPTPWSSWLSCEEDTTRADETAEKDHGFVFEVPARAEIGLAKPVPLTAMGRFRHEAIAVDPATGIVYQTEDLPDGVIYRFLPDHRGHLAEGGRLQALCIADRPGLDTRNWHGAEPLPLGLRMPVRWVDINNVLSPGDDLRHQARAKGAATFARAEGMWFGLGAVYFVCTNGGPDQRGQVWRYAPARPSGGVAGAESGPGAPPAVSLPPNGASAGHAPPGGVLELFIEPNDLTVMENGDNITTAPWGDLIVCEDGFGEQFLLGITPVGEVYKLARNASGDTELAGATFSPDGSTLFVNLQGMGLTLAVFRTGGRAWREA